jgi:hypothetical protein
MVPTATRHSGPPKWLFGWANRFTDTWGALPAEPILYFFMLVGTLQIVVSGRPTLTVSVDLPAWVESVWEVSSVIGPFLSLVAYVLVTRFAGRVRLFGLWNRFAGDFSQVISLTVFIMMRFYSSPVADDAHIYLMNIVLGVLCFVIMLVLRDVWTLIRVEEITAHLKRLEDAGLSIEGLQ